MGLRDFFKKDVNSWKDKGDNLHNLGRYEEALQAYDQALEIDPKNAVTWTSKGNTLTWLDRYEEALQAYDQALVIDPKNAEAWNSKGVSLQWLGRYEEALQAYDKALEINPKNAVRWNNEGNSLYNLGRYEEALQAYDKALELDPKDAVRWNDKGNTLFDMGRYEDALQAYDKALEINPKDGVIWNNKGNTLLWLGRYEDALQAYDKSLELDPINAEAWNSKGASLQWLGRYEDALQAYDQALELDQKDADAWTSKGNTLMWLGRYEEAIQAYDQAIEIDPKFAEAWSGKGVSLRYLGRNEEALQFSEKALDLDPKCASAWSGKGAALHNLDRYEEAIKFYNKALDLNPKYVGAWNNKGNTLNVLGRYEDALQACNKALDLYPKFVASWSNKGEVLNNLGRYEEAIKAYDKAIEINPKYVQAWSNKGEALSSLGRYEEAIKCYKRVKELNPEEKHIGQKLADLIIKPGEVSLKSLKREIEDAGKYILVPYSIIEILEKGVSEKADFARDQLKKLISEAKPVLHIKLDRTSLNYNEWHKSRIEILNEGNAHAFDVSLSFSDDFEVRRIIPVSINAGDKKAIEIALRPLVKGDLPLEIVASYKNGRGENFESKYSFWIDVKEAQETKKAKWDNSFSEFGNAGTFQSTFPGALAVKYTDLKYIGGGGFAKVFKAKRQDEKPVAIKLPISSDAATGKSFISELMNWTDLKHENIVRVYDYNILPVPYFEMELCDCALSEKQFPLDANSSALIIFNICEGLKYAHSKSIIHQDLKPHNILLKDGIPKISDWGLSKVATTSGKSSMGGFTPLYAAPEQISKKKKDSRTDIWQVGVIFYEMVTGKTPFEGDDLFAVMSGIAREDPVLPSLINPDAKKFDTFIVKCLKKNPENRYQSVSELQKELAEFLKIDYVESLRVSVCRNDPRRSAFYCGDLFLLHLKLGEIEAAYKYASDLSHYAQGEIKDLTNEFCIQLEIRIDSGIRDVPDELMKKAEIIAHKVGLGFRK